MSDPWSEIMRDAASGIAGEYHIERDDGRLDSLQVLDYIAPLLEWDEPERLGIQHVKGKVLDIGCGAGRVSLYLQNLGHKVVGIDAAPSAIEASKMRGLKEAYTMSASNLDFPESTFDSVILYGNNFGILGEDAKILNMLKMLWRITAPDGIIIAGSADVEKTDVKSHLEYHKWNLARGRPKGQIRLRISYKGLVDDWIELRFANPQEMRSLAERTGWQVSRIYQRDVPAYVGILRKS
jgi:SAM-dependent methyltransferase